MSDRREDTASEPDRTVYVKRPRGNGLAVAALVRTKIKRWGVAVLAAGGLALGAACTTEEPAAEPVREPPPAAEPAQPAQPAPPSKPAPAETPGQENARRSAEDYLASAAFSRKGLIEQLEFEGYSTEDATYAVDAVSPNWNEQAAKAAKDYLDTSPFSRSGLIEQLKFEGYTEQQAVYGVNQTGL